MKRTAWLFRSLTVCSVLLLFAALATAQNASPLPLSPVSTGVLMSRAIRAGKVQLNRGVNNNSIIPNLTCSPAPCALPNVNASQSAVLANETPVVVNKRNPNWILTGANDYNCANIQGFYASSDGGTTWKRTCLNSIAGDFGEGDPGVAYDTNNVAYISGIDATNGIVFETSTDNGATWSAVKKAVKPFFSRGLTDKPWLEIDTNPNSPFLNSIYISVTQFDSSETNITITVSHSNDGGATFTTVPVDTTQVFPNVDQFSDLAVGADGTVYVTWMRCNANGPSGDCGGTTATMYFSKSTDGGNTWSSPAVIDTPHLASDPNFCCFYGSLPNTFERLSNIPVIAVDTSNKALGMLYVVYYHNTGAVLEVRIARSSDGGNTWTHKLLSQPTGIADQFFPWVNVAPGAGIVGVTWLDRRNDPNNVNYEAFASVSGNRGNSFTAPLDLSAAPSDPFDDGFGGFFIGDYTGNAWAGRTLYMTYTDTTTGIDQDFLVGERAQ